jgi:prephenate dehydrogenase/chorismate mutase
MSDIAAHRARIDAIDEEIVRLLNARAVEALAIGAIKARTGVMISQPGRETAVLDHAVDANRGPFDEDGIRAVFRTLIGELSRLQRERGAERGPAPAPMVTTAPFARVGIIGLGLMGGSIALSLRRVWPHVHIVGLVRHERVPEMQQAGVVNEATDDLTRLAACDLVIIATPVPAALGLLPALRGLSSEAVITDVGSTKREIMAATAGFDRFIGGHPMAGTEKSGPAAAVDGLFTGRPWLLVNQSPARPAAGERLERFVAGLGALPRWIDAEPHDRAMAFVSHLPQLVAVALMNAATTGAGDAGLAMAGPAFGEMTRTASSPAAMWQDILSSNSDFVTRALAEFIACLPQTSELRSPSWVRDAFALSGAARDRWRTAERPL